MFILLPHYLHSTTLMLWQCICYVNLFKPCFINIIIVTFSMLLHNANYISMLTFCDATSMFFVTSYYVNKITLCYVST